MLFYLSAYAVSGGFMSLVYGIFSTFSIAPLSAGMTDYVLQALHGETDRSAEMTRHTFQGELRGS